MILSTPRYACLATLLLVTATPVQGQSERRSTFPPWVNLLSNAEQLALNDKVRQLSARLGVREKVLSSIANILRVNLKKGGFAELIRRLEEQAQRAKETQAQIAELEATVAALTDEKARAPAARALVKATAAFDEGRLEDAEKAFAELEGLRGSEAADARAAWLAARNSRAKIAELLLDFDRAEELRLSAAREIRRAALESQWLLTMDAAVSRYRQGNLLGDNEALKRAIEIYESEVLPLVPRAAYPSPWASTQNALGVALTALGAQEEGVDRLEAAVKAHESALDVWKREKAPAKWADAQIGIGNALHRLGERRQRTVELEKALIAYRSALEELQPDRQPALRSVVQGNIGTVLVQIGQRTEGTEAFEAAIEAFVEARSTISPQISPLRWAIVHSNLGDALKQLGNREGSPDRLEKAVEAYRASLAAFPREQAPLLWAKTQNDLGGVLASLGAARNRTDLLNDAAKAFRSALEERRPARSAVEWIETRLNLALAEGLIAAAARNPAGLDSAMAAARDAQADAGRRTHEPLSRWAGQVIATLEKSRRDLKPESER